MSTTPPSDMETSQPNLNALMDVQLPVSIRLGQTEMILEDILKLAGGSVIELNANINDPVDLIVNGRRFARGEIVAVDGFYGIRITEINKSRRSDDSFFDSGPNSEEKS